MNSWQAPKSTKLPNFIICGAMKCGTTTLHAILNQHPDVFIPEKEINFFDLDDVFQHPDFNLYKNNQWLYQNFDVNAEKYWQWYSSQFSLAKNGQCLGEDSTTYIASDNAVKRIAQQDKKIKIIVMLRNPVSRAYSHYWHLLRSGRAINTFEGTLQYNPFSILNRSMYVQQLKNVFKYLPKEQVKIVIFEDFISNVEKGANDICEFLEIDHNTLPIEAYKLHENVVRTPKYPKLQIIKNRCFPSTGHQQYQNHFEPYEKSKVKAFNSSSVIDFIHRKINPLVAEKPPLMKLETKLYLEDFFYRELKDLDNLIGCSVLEKWLPK